MPNIIVKIPAGTFDAHARQRLVEGINAAAAACERVPDDPRKRSLCWVVVEEVAPGHWTCGAADVTAAMIPVIALVHVPDGVLDDASGARYVELIHRAATAALPEEKRRIASSCIIDEVEDGTWGGAGRIWRLPQFAEAAGYEHLQHLVARR
jgi:phenylpyruvate tautomerase PptA (4-oxalocrotonate tautomerase family)